MKDNKLKPIMLGFFMVSVGITQTQAGITTKGISPASNTYKSFNQSSIVRDSEINQPLDLFGDFYPSIEVSYADHDNVRHRTDLDESDSKWVIKPGLAYRTNLGRHKLYASYNGVFTKHNDLDQEDAEANSLNARVGLDISKRLDIDVFAGVSDTFEERGTSGSRSFNQLASAEGRSPDELESEFYGADFIYGRKFSRLNAVLGFEKETTEYSDNGATNRDRDVDTQHLDVSYQVGAKTTVFARIQKYDTDYARTANSLDSEQTDYSVGVRWKSNNAVSGVIGVGRTDKDFDAPAREGYDGSTYYVNLNYHVSPFSVFTLNLSKLVEEPGDAESDYYESELIGLGWEHALTERWSFGIYGKLIDDDYNTERHDEFTDIGFNLDYLFRRWLTLGVYYGQVERDSNVDNIAYDDEYFGLRVKSDLRSIND